MLLSRSGGTTVSQRQQSKTDEMISLYNALASAVGEEVADRLFPGAWRHLRKIRSRERDRAFVEHKAHAAPGREIEPS